LPHFGGDIISNPLLIVGASGRAAAASAIRAGFEPSVIDLFADADTVRLCPTLKCDPAAYPHGFIELANRAPPGPWMYTGGLENYPNVIAAITETRELWGNPPERLAEVRDPFAVRERYQARACSIPALAPATLPPPAGRWLRKPFRGAGGGGITWADGTHPPSAQHFFQQFIPGDAISLLFVSEDWGLTGRPPVERAWPYTIGICAFRQLIGTPWLHARTFQYAGNIGPFGYRHFGLPCYGASVVGDLNDIRTHLSGIWGADFIVTDDEAWLIEINPRYPASAELPAYSRWDPFVWLKGCFTEPGCLLKAKKWSEWPTVIGKGIYYAADRITFPASGPWDDSLAHCTDVWRVPEFADIPHPGSTIEAGQPVFTLFAAAATEAECVNQLRAKAAACDRLFSVPTPEDNP
jgi:predicted ATP-grasp superfamily ATP-dependent carboligase